MAISSNYEILDRAAHIWRSDAPDKKTKASALFEKASKEVKSSVYENLFQKMQVTVSYWGCGEDAFHDQKGLSSTPEQKAQAIEGALCQMVVAMNLKGEPNVRDLHYYLGEVAYTFLGTHPARGMELFERLPKEVREEIYVELTAIHGLDQTDEKSPAADLFHDRNGLTTSYEQKSLSISCFLLKSIRELLHRKSDHALALDLFKKTHPQHRVGVFSQLDKINKEAGVQGIFGHDAFFSSDESRVLPMSKAQSITSYLREIQTAERNKLLDDCASRLEELALPKLVTEPSMKDEEVALEDVGIDELIAPGHRTRLTFGFRSGLSNFRLGKLIIDELLFECVSGGTQKFSSQRVVSCGSVVDREILYLDPARCPELEKHYQILRKMLTSEMTTEKILSVVVQHVRKSVFYDKQPRLVERVTAMVENAAKGPHTVTHSEYPRMRIPLMSIDEFVFLGLGVCRHHALVVSYILDRLMQEENPLIEGTVMHMRANLEEADAAHTWAAFIPKRPTAPPQPSGKQKAWKQLQAQTSPEKWHLDSFWDVLLNFAEPRHRATLRKSYGEKLITQELERTAEVAKLNGQPPI